MKKLMVVGNDITIKSNTGHIHRMLHELSFNTNLNETFGEHLTVFRTGLTKVNIKMTSV